MKLFRKYRYGDTVYVIIEVREEFSHKRYTFKKESGSFKFEDFVENSVFHTLSKPVDDKIHFEYMENGYYVVTVHGDEYIVHYNKEGQDLVDFFRADYYAKKEQFHYSNAIFHLKYVDDIRQATNGEIRLFKNKLNLPNSFILIWEKDGVLFSESVTSGKTASGKLIEFGALVNVRCVSVLENSQIINYTWDCFCKEFPDIKTIIKEY